MFYLAFFTVGVYLKTNYDLNSFILNSSVYRFICKSILHALLLLCCPLLHAQNEINFKQYSISEGLSQNTVYSMLEDREGIIWIGTEDGLNRFDGYEFTYYRHELKNANSISQNQVNALYQDKAGNIWIGTSDGLNILDKKTEKITRLSTARNERDESNDFITSIYEDRKGNIWITSLEGLKRYLPATKKFQLYSYQDNRRADKILEDSREIFWVSVDRDLRCFNPSTGQFVPLPPLLENNQLLRKSYVRSIKEDHTGKVWFATELQGVFVYDSKANNLQHFVQEEGNDKSLPANIIRELFFDRDNRAWVGTRNGLSLFDSASKTFTTYRHNRFNQRSISQNSIRTILQDKAGNIWVGTYSGGFNLITAHQGMFRYTGVGTPNSPGLSYKIASAVYGAPDGGLWVGTEGGGLNHVSADHRTFKNYSLPLTSNNIGINTIKCMLPDEDGLWVGTVNGLNYFDAKTGSLKKIFAPQDNREITSLVKLGDDLWLATNGSGLLKRDKNGQITTFVRESGKLGLLSNNVSSIVKNNKGHLWVGTSRGLNYFDGKTFQQFYHQQNNPFSLSNSSISTLFIDSRNRLWVGTKGNGLNLFEEATGKFYAIDKSFGLANDVVQSIEEDDKGTLWVSTNKGLSKIMINAAPPFTKNAVTVTNYFAEDGLQSNQFFPNSSYKNEKGELFFGGINGLSYFNPNSIRNNEYKPPVILTGFLIRNKVVDQFTEGSPLQQSINETEEIILSYDQAFITFRFAALNYVNPVKNQYAYQLQGLKGNEDWNYVGNQRLATYTNLNAGSYVFKVKAANNDGLWSDAIKTIRITVLPPWWATWWAYTLYALIIGGLLYLYYSYSLKTVKLKNELTLEQVVREKEQELYQQKLNFFTNISHEIKTPLTLILAPLEKLLESNPGNNRVHHQMMLMKRNGERLSQLISQLLDFRKFESGKLTLEATEGNIVSFVKEVLSSFEAYAAEHDIRLTFEENEKAINAWFDEDKLEKILYNLLSNALKFTRKEGLITVRLKEVNEPQPGYVLIEVEDNGIGIAPDKLGGIFEQFSYYDEEGMNLHGSGIGLAFTKGLVELHQGEITVNSVREATGNLTCFSIKLPLGKDHLKPEQISTRKKDSENIEAYLQLEDNHKMVAGLADRAAKVLSAMDEVPVLLIVEDNKDVMELLRDHFEEKFNVHLASDGQEGIEKSINLIPDVIISDVMMPKVSGTVLCSTLKTDNRTSHIPIILLTARTQVTQQIEGLETGADDYITKPFNIGLLEARVWNLIEQRQQLRERYKKEITLQPSKLAITSPDEEFLEKIMAYIEENISEPTLNVEDLAKQVYMSRTTLYRKMKALTNQSIVEFIRSVRLKRAAQLLETNQHRITEIAHMTGFAEIDYFRKCFKEQYKQTPTEYLQNHLKQ